MLLFSLFFSLNRGVGAGVVHQKQYFILGTSHCMYRLKSVLFLCQTEYVLFKSRNYSTVQGMAKHGELKLHVLCAKR